MYISPYGDRLYVKYRYVCEHSCGSYEVMYIRYIHVEKLSTMSENRQE